MTTLDELLTDEQKAERDVVALTGVGDVTNVDGTGPRAPRLDEVVDLETLPEDPSGG